MWRQNLSAHPCRYLADTWLWKSLGMVIRISPFKNFIIYKPTILESPMNYNEKNISYMGSATVHSRVINASHQTASYLHRQYRKLCSITDVVDLVLWEGVQINFLCRMHCVDTIYYYFLWLNSPLLGQGILLLRLHNHTHNTL